jgi:hypothetical protein
MFYTVKILNSKNLKYHRISQLLRKRLLNTALNKKC